MTKAEKKMRKLAKQSIRAWIGVDKDGSVCLIEDYADPDGRVYRMEYQATPDGKHATAYCRFNPWSTNTRPNAGTVYDVSHVGINGFICVGSNASEDYKKSPYNLEYVVKQARYWCTGFSVMKETGKFPQP